MSARDRALRDLADAIARLVDARVEEPLAARGIVSGLEYSGDQLPPKTNRRQLFAACRAGKVAGAVRDGRGWRCSAAAWAEYRARGAEDPVRGAAAKSTKATPTPAAKDVEELDAMLTGAGMRRTKGAR